MKAIRQILLVATALAVLSMLGLASAAAASPTIDPGGSGSPRIGDDRQVPNSGHGAQFDRDDATAPVSPAVGDQGTTAPAARGRELAPVLYASLAALLLTLAAVAGATWRRRRPRAAI
jgi:hypothetical protein